MLQIKVLGPGCRNCERLAQSVAEAVEAVAEQQADDLDVTIQKVKEVEEIMKYPILYTPGLVINEKLVSAGRLPPVEEIKGWLNQALQAG